MGKLIYSDTLYMNLTQASLDLDKLLIDINTNPKKYVQFSLINKNKK
jgi:phospholipid/cholesterol/gamma-HCH transport system substrate-binding protein